MNYLITGGTGLIGKALIAKLLTQEACVTVLTRNVNKAKILLTNSVTFISELSLSDIENSDVVINLAGEAIADKRWTVKQKKDICDSRWHITAKLVELINCAKKPPSLFISGSAIGVYGRQGHQVIDEDHQSYHQEFTHEVCHKWEQLALNAKSTSTRVALLRTGIVLAEHGGAIGKMLLPFKLSLGGKISNGEQIMSWIHIDDMVSGILHVQECKTLEGAINLTAPAPVSNEVFSKALAKQLQRPCFITTPAWLLKVLLGEMSDLLLFGQHVVPNKLVNSGFSFRYKTIDNAFSNLIK
jgi:uncharacterized protein (TIGR01777 family)